MPTRTTYLAGTFNGSALTGILSASCTYSYRLQVPQALVTVHGDPFPGSQPYDAELELSMGAGSHNVVRFRGLFRKYSPFALWEPSLGLLFHGHSVRLQEYSNFEDPTGFHNGLALGDLLLGSETGTDQDVVTAVLNKVGVSFNPLWIGGTGVTWGSRGSNPLRYVWRAGTNPNLIGVPITGAGETAMAYIQNWDAVSAVYTGPTDPVGFFRTFELPDGIHRALIGGRPRSTPVLTFSEGLDLLPGSLTTRSYPEANAVLVQGYDFGFTTGPVKNYDALGNFLGQSSNPFQPSTRTILEQLSSPYIEWSNEAEGGIGMNCERVGNALLADLNRETVEVRFVTPRDDVILPGMTILVQGPGGAPGRLGVGEPLWIEEVTTQVTEDGSFTQQVTAVGGGLPDDHTPAPPS